MPTYRCQITIPMFTNVPRDVVTNTIHIDPVGPATLDDVATTATPIIAAFYNAVYASARMANYMRPANATMRWYDLADPQPRVPIIKPAGFTMSPGTSVIPTEAAAVVSFQGDPISGVPMARRRGRIYLGGLGTAALEAGTLTSYPILSPAFITVLSNQMTILLRALDSAGMHLSVWSPTDSASTLVTNGWVDHGIDTQRRRSVEATARTTYTD